LCIVKKIILNAKNTELRKKVLDNLLVNMDYLIQNSHGNYAVQVALDVSDGFFLIPIINELQGKLHKYSLLKFSSNVVEKCLELGGENAVNKFIEEICQKNKVLGKLKNLINKIYLIKIIKKIYLKIHMETM